MHALYLLIPFLGICVIAYRYYSAFLAAKVLVLNDARVTPAHERYDGQNYYPVSRWVLFGSHFSAIAGAGPLIGPVLAAQFGYAPGFIWLIAGCCLGGAVHGLVMLWASTRRGGKSLAEIARQEIGSAAGMLIGLVTKNGILIVEFANQRKRAGLSKVDAVHAAAVARLRPILMTSLAMILGALPIALALGSAAGSRKSMGVAVVGGLLFSGFLGLYIVPAAYAYLSRPVRQETTEEQALLGVTAH